MRIPYWFQGALFGPAFIMLIFALKVTCPVPTGSGCFADSFAGPVFLPAIFLDRVFGGFSSSANQEILLIIFYWATVGLLVGLYADILKKNAR